jgi:hypothetical protein
MPCQYRIHLSGGKRFQQLAFGVPAVRTQEVTESKAVIVLANHPVTSGMKMSVAAAVLTRLVRV